MKKLVSLLLPLWLLCACTATVAESLPLPDPSLPEASPIPTAGAPAPAAAPGPLTLLDMNNSGLPSAAPDGFFYETLHIGSTGTVTRYDPTTMQRTFLDGGGDLTSAPVHIEATTALTGFTGDGWLYAIMPGLPAFYEVEEDPHYLGRVWRMAADGTQRTELPLSPTQRLVDYAGIASGSSSLYAILLEYDPESHTYLPVLTRLDMATAETTPLWPATFEDGMLTILSAFDGTLLLKEESLSISASAKGRPYQSRLVHYSIATGETETGEWQAYANSTLTQVGGALYSIEGNCVYSHDPATLEATLIAQVSPEGFEVESLLFASAHLDGLLFLHMVSEGAGTTNTIALELATGALRTPTLQLTEGVAGHITLPTCAIGDKLLVWVGDRAFPFSDTDPHGTPFEATRSIREYALISEADYWNGVPNLEYFEDLVFPG